MSIEEKKGRRGAPTSASGENQGEGNRTAARRFNRAEQEFVQSKKGREKIARAGDVDPSEAPELEHAERVGRSHGKHDDSEVNSRPDSDADDIEKP